MAAPKFHILRPVSHDAWLQARENGIGASEVGTILGLNPYDTPYRLWRRKLHIDEPTPENDAMRLGHVLEDAVSNLWQQHTGRQVIKASQGDWIMQDPENRYLQVSPDRTYWLEGLPHNRANKGILECKTTRMKVDNDSIPLYWVAQVQYQLMVSRYQQASLAWLINGHQFGWQDFAPSPQLHEVIREAVTRFWVDNICGRLEPDLIDAQDALLKFPVSQDAQVCADVPVSQAIEQYREVTTQLAQLSDRKEKLGDEIKLFMRDNERLVDTQGRTLATWKSSKPASRFDERRFAADHPDLHGQYRYTANPSRRLIIK